MLMIIYNINTHTYYKNRGGGAVGYSVGDAGGGLGFRIPAATDRSHKNRKWQLHF